MSNVDEIAPYLDRLQFLDKGKNWVIKFKDIDYMQSFVKVLLDFSAFALDYFSYFAPTLTELRVRGVAASDRQRLSIVLSRLHQEWMLLQRVGQQWELTDTEFKKALKQARTTAIDFYNLYQGPQLEKAEPIVYFEKSYEISRSLYSASPIISIPFDDFAGSEGSANWSALAHELGHYFYWNAAPSGEVQKIHHALRDHLVAHLAETTSFTSFFQHTNLIGVWNNWLEETVADICGTLMGGEKFVTTGFERMHNRLFTEEDLTADDEEHPAPILRYQIGVAVLESVAPGMYISLASKLKSNAVTLISENAILHNSDQPILIADIEAIIPEVVDILLNKAAVWQHKDGRKVALRELFNLNALLEDAARFSTQSANNSQPDHKNVMEEFVDLIEVHRQSDLYDDAFRRLLNNLKQQFVEVPNESEKQTKIHDALLDLNLGEEDDEKWCCVKWKKC